MSFKKRRRREPRARKVSRFVVGGEHGLPLGVDLSGGLWLAGDGGWKELRLLNPGRARHKAATLARQEISICAREIDPAPPPIVPPSSVYTIDHPPPPVAATLP